MDITQLIERARERAKTDPQTAAAMLRDAPEVKDAGLYDLVWLLDQGEYGCHKNDVLGVIELLEHYLKSQEA